MRRLTEWLLGLFMVVSLGSFTVLVVAILTRLVFV